MIFPGNFLGSIPCLMSLFTCPLGPLPAPAWPPAVPTATEAQGRDGERGESRPKAPVKPRNLTETCRATRGSGRSPYFPE